LFAALDKDAAVALKAERILIQIGKGGIPDFVRELSSKDVRMRVLCVRMLGLIRPDYVPAELSATVHDKSVEVRREAAQTLGVLAEHYATLAPLGKLMRDGDPRVRLLAASGYGRHLGALTAALRDGLRSRRPGVREGCALAVGEMGKGIGLTALQPLAADPDANVRAAAIRACAKIAAYQAVPVLKRALSDSSAAVRVAAVIALGSLRSRANLGLLTGMLADGDDDVRATTVFWLAELKDPSVVETLVRSAKTDSAAGVRAIALTALKKFRSSNTEKVLQEALSDRSHEVRVAASAVINEWKADNGE
jgi:HEAT repeat protein